MANDLSFDVVKAEISELEKLRKESEQAEQRYRQKLADTCIHILELEKQEGVPRTEIYEKLGVSRETGRKYFMLAELYARLTEEDLRNLKTSKSMLSLGQAEAVSKAIDGVDDDEAMRLVREVAAKRTDPRDVETLVGGGKGGKREKLAEQLGVSKDQLAEAKAVAPKPKEVTAARAPFAGQALVISTADHTIPGLFAALTDEGVMEELAEALSEGKPIVLAKPTGRV